MKKFNISTKKANGKWWSYLIATQFEDSGNYQISVTLDNLKKLVADIESGAVPTNKGYINFSMFENKPREEKISW